MTINTEDKIPAVMAITRSQIREHAKQMSSDEARIVVANYYMAQEDRKRYNNQQRSIEEGTDNIVLKHMATVAESSEAMMKKALSDYVDEHPVGRWLVSIHGIGPVIAAGLLAHIDITKAPTAGHIWSFAGLNPNQVWEKGKKRPFNAQLKKICWYAGQCFMKFSGSDKCYYGKIYRERKAYEIERNDSGGNAELAKSILASKNFNKETDAYKHLSAGHLPPAQIDARARRYAVKIFLSHLQMVWYKWHFKVDAPKPFAIAILGHAHMIEPPAYITD